MKYRRKMPVDAIQWTGYNQEEIHEFIVKTAKYCCSKADKSGSLIIVYKDNRDRTFKTIIPELGWIVREGNTFQFYKNKTFHKTFEEVPDDEHKEVMDGIYKDCENHVNKILEDINAAIEKRHFMFGKYDNLINPGGLLAKLIDDFYKGDDKTREEVEKQLSEGLNGMAGSDTNKATFESVLDEMKELHAKKNAYYGDAAHVNFLKYGPVASLSRLSEKMQRAEHILLSGKCEVKDEPLTETLIDIAITSAMLYMELKNKDNG